MRQAKCEKPRRDESHPKGLLWPVEARSTRTSGRTMRALSDECVKLEGGYEGLDRVIVVDRALRMPGFLHGMKFTNADPVELALAGDVGGDDVGVEVKGTQTIHFDAGPLDGWVRSHLKGVPGWSVGLARLATGDGRGLLVFEDLLRYVVS